MKLTVKGAPGAPVALLIHPMLADETFFDDVIDALHGRYRVAVPTLDGHYAGSPDFVSARQEAEVLLRKLSAEGVAHVRVMLGCSLGAAVALELLAQAPRGFAQVSVFDSPTLMDSALSRAICARDLCKLRKRLENKPEKARRLVDTRDAEYAYTVTQTLRTASPASVRAMTDAACHATLPQVPESVQPFMTFTWGSFDPSMKAWRRVQRAYPRANLVVKDRYAHCDYLMMHTEEFVGEFLL